METQNAVDKSEDGGNVNEETDLRFIEYLNLVEGVKKGDKSEQVVYNTQEEATTVEELFEQALKESPGRGKPMKLGLLLKGVHEGDPHEKKTINKNREDDLCTLCLHGRAWELVL